MPSRARLDGVLATVQPPYYRTQFLGRLVPGLYQSLLYLIVIAALWILSGTTSGDLASLGAVVLLLVRGGTYGQMAQTSYQAMRQGLPYMERLEAARQRYLSSLPESGVHKVGTVRALAFDTVSFAYQEDRSVLSDITFEVAGGETIGIVGPSGAGKSTLVQLLLALRTATSGSYLINGLPVEEFSRDDWNRQVAYVPQQPQLLHASAAANISFFRDVDDDSILDAAKLAGIHEDIMRWPLGYDTIIGPRADAVSGGQQQRICLARALATRPQLLVLDEPTSALDPHSEFLIQQSLLAVKEQVTLVIVAHRFSLLEICRRIMVIVNGTLEAFDDVGSVRQRSAYYRSAAGLSGDRSGALQLSVEQ
jgi:ABC-type multidrug transport system fused ATPase/permease subunit